MTTSRFRDPSARIDYLDQVAASTFGRGYKPETLRLLDARGGQRVLDLGCGTGDDARAIAAGLGAGGAVTGVDTDEAMLVEARRRGAGEHGNVEFKLGDAADLPFPDASFDASRADRVFQLLSDRHTALRELIRVTAPGGYVVVSNPGGGAELDVGVGDLARRILGEPLAMSRDGWSGVELPNLFKACGLVDVTVKPHAHCFTDGVASEEVTPLEVIAEGAVRAGAVSEEEARRFVACCRQATREGRFTFTHTLMIVRGTVG